MKHRPLWPGALSKCVLAAILITCAAGSVRGYQLERVALGAAAIDQTDGAYRIQGTLAIASSVDQTDGAYVAGVGFWKLISLDAYTGVPGGDEAPFPSAPPKSFELFPNHPNPFNPTTEIPFTLPASGHASLRIYDVSGREVATLLDREMPAGRHAIVFTSTELASGIYFYRLTTGGKTLSRRMTLVK